MEEHRSDIPIPTEDLKRLIVLLDVDNDATILMSNLEVLAKATRIILTETFREELKRRGKK